MTVSGNKRDAKQLLPDYEKFIPSVHRTTMTGTNSSMSQRKLEDKLILYDGSKFFMSDSAERFRLLDKGGMD